MDTKAANVDSTINTTTDVVGSTQDTSKLSQVQTLAITLLEFSDLYNDSVFKRIQRQRAFAKECS
jgi:hypothetical protein